MRIFLEDPADMLTTALVTAVLELTLRDVHAATCAPLVNRILHGNYGERDPC